MVVNDKNETVVLKVATNYAALGCNKHPTIPTIAKDTDGDGIVDTIDEGDCFVVGFASHWTHPNYNG